MKQEAERRIRAFQSRGGIQAILSKKEEQVWLGRKTSKHPPIRILLHYSCVHNKTINPYTHFPFILCIMEK